MCATTSTLSTSAGEPRNDATKERDQKVDAKSSPGDGREQDKVLQSPMYLNSRGICCYLSMTNELQTNKLIESSLSDSKLVYIPKVIGSNATDMQIHQIHSLEQVKSFPKSSWGIPEPPDDALCSNDYAQSVDVVFLPGVAFDRSCRRLGHGKGYYGLATLPLPVSVSDSYRT
jgi:5,10-methenyltetrahydrofolate synthetase